ncbi:MAG: SDR family NAD(P)-dependent oxidoreductase, partial [Myxococcota bacterium]
MVSRGGEGMARWRGKVALVTGASAGIGRAVARRLADEGLRVVGWGRRAEALEALGEELEGRDFAWRSVELRELAQLRAAFDALRATHGGVDVLVNSAGVSGDAPLVGGD